MKKLLVALLTLGIGFSANADNLPLVKLKKENTVSIRLPIYPSFTNKVKEKLIETSQNLPKDDYIFLFLDTPGGSITEGVELIQTAEGLPQKVVTITNFAASMGFVIAQHLDTRVILPRGIMMSHRAFVGIEGQLPGELDTRIEFWKKYVKSIESQQADRMELSLEDYRKLRYNEYWVQGKGAVKDKSADRVALVRCHKSLDGTSTQTIQSLFGPIKVTWSDCPLNTQPLEVDFSMVKSWGNEFKNKFIRESVLKILYDKKQKSVIDFVHSNEFKEIF